jgi:hypothetical protein
MAANPPSKAMLRAINNIGKVCPRELKFDFTLCRTRHLAAVARRQKGKAIEFDFCESCELITKEMAKLEKKNKKALLEAKKITPKTTKEKVFCPRCQADISTKRKVKGLCINCYQKERRENKAKTSPKLNKIEPIPLSTVKNPMAAIDKIVEEAVLNLTNRISRLEMCKNELNRILTIRKVVTDIIEEENKI